MFEPKIPAIAASIGFVLSLLIGVLSGAAFGIVLVRAVGMGLLFAVLAFVGQIVIIRFLPELLESDSADSGPALDSGNLVDITVGEGGGEENPFSTQTGSDRMVPDFLENHDTYDQGAFSAVSAQDEGEMTEESPQPSRKSNPASANQTSGTKLNQSRSSGGLDVLPDLQDFIPQVSVNSIEEDDEGATVTDGTGLSHSLFTESDTSGSTVESETMAKAIRTILSRDP